VRRYRFAFALAISLSLAAMIPPAVAHEADAERKSPNMSMVARIPGIGGTDIELFTRSLTTYKAADGTMVTSETPVDRHFALVGGTAGNKGAQFVDVSNPEAPYIVASMGSTCSIGQGDVQVTADGMLAAIAKQGGGTCKSVTGKTLANGSALVDISDIYAPKVVGLVEQSGGSHNHTIHPSGKYLYISPSLEFPGGPGNSAIPIWDISDPTNPRFIKTFTTAGDGPHDIRFSKDGKRAYIASVSTYYILNTENPENPTVISTMAPPGGYIGHDTLVTPDKAFVILGDEAGGGANYPCPGGAIYIYDIRDETKPLLVGFAEAGGGPIFPRNLDDQGQAGVAVPGGCTSHVMELNPDNKSLSIGWYSLGTRTFSFASLYNADGTPKPTGQIAAAWGKNGVGLVETGYIIPDASSTWSAKQYSGVPGYIFSNASGTGGGLYVTKISAPSY
jgi:hypothetical protein